MKHRPSNEGSAYVVHGSYSRGVDAESRLLPGFKVGVTDVFTVDR
ncbi:MAG TPA: hypothetical protein VJY33_12915 [Isosphaeraceae bacterium]|nr:hypothetical protein [Isosphaeraceae bacterium]